MAAPPSLEEGKSTTRPPRFNGQFYGWWKTLMHDYINAEDTGLWDVILDGPYIPTKDVVDGDLTKVIPNTRREYNEADRKNIEKNYKEKKLLVCGIGPNEYNRISACETTKKYETVSKQLMKEQPNMKKGETIHEMHTRFTSITNELRCLGESIHPSKQIQTILGVLPKSWESKVNAIIEARDLKGSTVKEGNKEKSIALKMSLNDGLEEEDEMTCLTRRFQKIIKKHGGF
ncbi:hypothetical protein KY289_016153 [Solanum tuberosum]|nr:hypothetical protein KY289_016153 [Solanum tuberosum]